MNMNRIPFALAAVAMAATVTSLAAVPAMAQEMPFETIQTAAYDLGSEAGYATVARQIGRAATRVCGATERRNLSTAPKAMACRQIALEDGMRQLEQRTNGASVTVVASR